MFLFFSNALAHSWGAWGLTFACSLIAALGSIGRLAALASTIVIQKDWTAVLANGDEAKLARKISNLPDWILNVLISQSISEF